MNFFKFTGANKCVELLLYNDENFVKVIVLDKEAANDIVERVALFLLFATTALIVAGEQTNNVWLLPPLLLVLELCIIKDCCANGLNPAPAAGDPNPEPV